MTSAQSGNSFATGAEPAPATPPPGSARLSRRSLLGLLTAAAGMTGAAVSLGAGTAAASPNAAASDFPAIQHPPSWIPTWKAPIRRLDDFVARSPHTRFLRGAIMLTIDDGPHPHWTPLYLKLLARHHVQATFSVIGSQVGQYPHLVKA